MWVCLQMGSCVTYLMNSVALHTSCLLLPPTRTAQCSPEPVQTLLLAAGLWCRGAVLQVDFITKHYFCSFTLAIHFTYRINILAPVKSLGPVPVGTEPGFPPALRIPYRKWQFHSAASIATGNFLPLQSCFKRGKITVAVFCSISVLCSLWRRCHGLSLGFLLCNVQFRATCHLSSQPSDHWKWQAGLQSQLGLFTLHKCSWDLGHRGHLAKITLLSDLAFFGKIIANSCWCHINEEVIKLQWNSFLYRCYLSKLTKECTNCRMPCFGGRF